MSRVNKALGASNSLLDYCNLGHYNLLKCEVMHIWIQYLVSLVKIKIFIVLPPAIKLFEFH